MDFSQKATQRIASAPKLGILTNLHFKFSGSSTPARHVKPAVAAATYNGARRNTCPAAGMSFSFPRAEFDVNARFRNFDLKWIEDIEDMKT